MHGTCKRGQTLQAFKEIPKDVFARLCKGILFAHLPPRALVCEEDDPSDCMYIIVSGQCDVRAKAPPTQGTKEDYRFSTTLSMLADQAPEQPTGQVEAADDPVVSLTKLCPHARANIICVLTLITHNKSFPVVFTDTSPIKTTLHSNAVRSFD